MGMFRKLKKGIFAFHGTSFIEAKEYFLVLTSEWKPFNCMTIIPKLTTRWQPIIIIQRNNQNRIKIDITSSQAIKKPDVRYQFNWLIP